METVVQNCLYQNGQPVLFNTNSTVTYTGSTLEIKPSISDTNYNIEFVKITDGAKVFLLSTRNILTNISYNDLLKQAMIFGNSLVTLEDGIKYKIKLITNDQYNRYILNSGNFTSLISPTTQDETVGGYTEDTIITSISNNTWHWWNLETLTSSFSDSNNLITRGKGTINNSGLVDKNTRSASVGWRLFLEKYNTPPVISGSNGSLGSRATYLTQTYKVTDADNDLYKVEELLDGVVIRTLENKNSGTEFTLSLQTQWSGLSVGSHTVTIRVTDICDNVVTRIYSFYKIDTSSSGTSKTLVRPSIDLDAETSLMLPIDGNKDATFTFSANGGGRVYANEFIIKKNSNLEIVYNKKITTFEFKHTVPAGVIPNLKGESYQLMVRTYDTDDLYSEWSDIVIVKALTPANLIITNIIDGKITTQNPLYTATYYQKEDETLYSYIFNLYKDDVLIDSSGELKDGLLQYKFDNGLENKTIYEIELKIKTKNNLITTIRQEFYSIFEQVRFPIVMELNNSYSTGCNEIKTYVRQILGRIESGDDIYYIDGTWADLHNTKVIFDEKSSFRLDGEWTMKIWARDLEDANVLLMNLSNDIGYIELTRYGNEFWLKKYVNNTLLYERYDSVSGDLNSEDQFFFFIQHVKTTGLMNFSVTRLTDGTTTWFKPQTSTDLPPSLDNTQYNYYNLEDGFLTNLSAGMRSILVPVSIDGVNTKCYIPSKDELIGDDCFELFKSLRPIEDSNYNTIPSSELGNFVLGISILGSEGDNSGVSIVCKNNYTDGNPVQLNYKIINFAQKPDIYLYEKVDDITFNTKYKVNKSDEFTLDLTRIWDDLTYGIHTLKIVLKDSLNYTYTKTLTFSKTFNLRSHLTQSAMNLNNNTNLTLIKGQAYKYFTRSIDTTDINKLVTIDTSGNISSEYPKAMDTGIRVVLTLPVSTRCTTFIKNNVYTMFVSLNTNFTPAFKTQTIDKLRIGDRVKECFTRYSNENIEFTIVEKNETTVTIMSDVIAIKPFDVAESVLINGDTSWNNSNIKQWLNSNNTLVRRK